MPDYAYMYALPYRFYEQYRLRRYGFHGTSHKFVAEKACKFTGLDFAKSRIITCHLGNGSSITAIKNGQSVDTSMGFTPVEGVVMGTRVGNLDVGAVTFIQEKENMDYSQVNALLNKKSGLKSFFFRNKALIQLFLNHALILCDLYRFAASYKKDP